MTCWSPFTTFHDLFVLQVLFSFSSITIRAAVYTDSELWEREISWMSQWVSYFGGSYFNLLVSRAICNTVSGKWGKGERWRQLLTSVWCHTDVRVTRVGPHYAIFNVKLSSSHFCSIRLYFICRLLLLLLCVSVEGFQSWMWRGLTFLLPFLFFGHVSSLNFL